MKKTFIAISLALFSCLILAACTANATSTQEIPSNSGKNQPVSTNIGQDTSDAVADENCLPGGPSDTQLEYWEIDEFEDWMEQQRDQIQKLADNKDKSFYYKDDNGSYVCREWTQEDVDTISRIKRNMVKGYIITLWKLRRFRFRQGLFPQNLIDCVQ